MSIIQIDHTPDSCPSLAPAQGRDAAPEPWQAFLEAADAADAADEYRAQAQASEFRRAQFAAGRSRLARGRYWIRRKSHNA